MRSLNRRRWLAIGLASVLLVGLPSIVAASHSWGGYHWARTSNPFTLQLDDNVSSAWDGYLAKASSDWTKSSVLHTKVAIGTSNPRKCRATLGRVEVCNAGYGNTGWLGVAQIWITGGTHIVQGTVKVNDTYFNTSTYNTPAWRQMVMCQEIGHTFGLDHQDTTFGNANLGTCMDYTNDPSTNQQPNTGDYDELLCIYDQAKYGVTLSTSTHSCTGTGHLDSTTTVASMPAASVGASADAAADAAWGSLEGVTSDGHGAWYIRDLGAGNLILTHVLWAYR
jgi:hypothetical protein